MANLTPVPEDVLAYTGATIGHRTAGEDIDAGQAIYVLSSDKKAYLAEVATEAQAAAVGVAVNTAATGQPVAYCSEGGLDPGDTVVVGTIYGVTDDAGAIGPVSDLGAGEYVTILGIAVTASRIDIKINRSGVAIPE